VLSSNFNISVNRMHPCSIGYGRRFGIWLQGCSLRCPGCCSVDTWAAGARHAVNWHGFSAMLDFQLSRGTYDGITISGGEPFEQVHALRHLLIHLRARRETLQTDWDILLYTGREFNAIRETAGVLEHVDLLVAGPYKATFAPSPLRGSANQTLHRLTALARSRYTKAWLSGTATQPRIDVAMTGADMILAGIARNGDFPKIEQALSERGVSFRARSWAGQPRLAQGGTACEGPNNMHDGNLKSR